jgi:hypothetical protein
VNPIRATLAALAAAAICISLAAAASGANGIALPNQWSLANANDSLWIVYTTAHGQPQLALTVNGKTTRYQGPYVQRATSSALGAMVTVTTRMTVDTGDTTLTLLLPQVEFGQGHTATVRTYALIANNSTFLGMPGRTGQMSSFSAVPLSGQARLS